VDICLEGLHYLYFELSLRASRVRIEGRVRVELVAPLGAGGMRVAFEHFPDVSMELESTVSLGFVPVPVQDQIADLVRGQMRDWIAGHVVAPAALHISPTGKPVASTFGSGPDPGALVRLRSSQSANSVASLPRDAPTIAEEPSPVRSKSGGDELDPPDDEVQRAVIAALNHRMMSS